jgi:hypothetical protein
LKEKIEMPSNREKSVARRIKESRSNGKKDRYAEFKPPASLEEALAGGPVRKRNLKRDLNDHAGDAADSMLSVVIDQPTILRVAVEVAGTAPLIQNRFSQKAVEEMLKKHMGISVQREPKRPRQVLEDATVYNMDKRVAIPPAAFKLAMISASTQLKTFKKTQLRIALFVKGNSIPITYTEMVPGMDIVRLAGIGRTPDIRFRPYFHGWKARMIIQFADTLSAQTVIDLLNRAGSVGVCEWRPEHDGNFGTFQVVRHVSDPKEIGEVEAECSSPIVPLRIPTWALDAEIDPEVIQQMFQEQQPTVQVA